MRKACCAVFMLSLVTLFSFHQSATAEDVTGRWTGKSANEKEQSGGFVDIKENADGTLTGKWGSKGNVMTIEKGERVTADVLRWESTFEGGRWVVQAKVDGSSMVLDYSSTHKENGKIKGGVARSVLTRKK